MALRTTCTLMPRTWMACSSVLIVPLHQLKDSFRAFRIAAQCRVDRVSHPSDLEGVGSPPVLKAATDASIDRQCEGFVSPQVVVQRLPTRRVEGLGVVAAGRRVRHLLGQLNDLP